MAQNLSQQALGDRVGVSKVTISDLERGNMRLDVDYMRRIACALGVTAADLLPPDANPWALDDDERTMIERYRMATEAQRDQLHRMQDVIVPFAAQPREAA